MQTGNKSKIKPAQEERTVLKQVGQSPTQRKQKFRKQRSVKQKRKKNFIEIKKNN